MPERAKSGERRRSPRFTCSGQAQITCLPSNGVLLPGKIRDLSIGGCCLDAALPIESGQRAEMVVRVNSSSFRVVGEVKAIHGGSATGIEFVQVSNAGKRLLRDVIAELARLQAITDDLKSIKREIDSKSFRKQISYRQLQADMLRTRFPFLAALPDEDADINPKPPGSNGSEGEDPPVAISLDIFG